MKLIATLNNIDSLDEILKLTDGLVVYSSDFSSFSNFCFSTSEIKKVISLSCGKDVIIDISFMLENEEIDKVTNFILQFKDDNVKFMFCDLGIFQILKELELEDRAIYNPNTLITNSYDLGFYLNENMMVKISEEITLKDQIKMINLYKNKTIKTIFGYHLMFHSKRYLISLYKEFLNKDFTIDNENSYLIEQTRKDKYHIVESKRGTSLYRPYILDNTLEFNDLKNLAYGIIDSQFISNDTYLKVLNIYHLLSKEEISCDFANQLISNLDLNILDGFKYEDTIYQRELMK